MELAYSHLLEKILWEDFVHALKRPFNFLNVDIIMLSKELTMAKADEVAWTAYEAISSTIRTIEAPFARLNTASNVTVAGFLKTNFFHSLKDTLTNVAKLTGKLAEAVQNIAYDPLQGRIGCLLEDASQINSLFLFFNSLDQSESGSLFGFSSWAVSYLSLYQARFRDEGIKVSIQDQSNDTELEGNKIYFSAILGCLIQRSLESLRTSNKQKKWINIRLAVVDGMTEISVTDNGPQINPKLIRYIFDPEYSANPYRAGIDLALAQKVVSDIFRGDINIRSNKTHTSFKIRIKTRDL